MNGFYHDGDMQHQAKIAWTTDLAEDLEEYEMDVLDEMFKEMIGLFIKRFGNTVFFTGQIGFCLDDL